VKKYGLILFVVLIAALAQAQNICPGGLPYSWLITWSGPLTGCKRQSGVCASGEPIPFVAQPLPCAPNQSTFTWDFGDGTPFVVAQSPTHTYAKPGWYRVALVPNDPFDPFPVEALVVVGPSVPTFSPVTFALLGVGLCAAAWLTLRR
jgi:hypothetical protein